MGAQSSHERIEFARIYCANWILKHAGSVHIVAERIFAVVHMAEDMPLQI